MFTVLRNVCYIALTPLRTNPLAQWLVAPEERAIVENAGCVTSMRAAFLPTDPGLTYQVFDGNSWYDDEAILIVEDTGMGEQQPTASSTAYPKVAAGREIEDERQEGRLTPTPDARRLGSEHQLGGGNDRAVGGGGGSGGDSGGVGGESAGEDAEKDFFDSPNSQSSHRSSRHDSSAHGSPHGSSPHGSSRHDDSHHQGAQRGSHHSDSHRSSQHSGSHSSPSHLFKNVLSVEPPPSEQPIKRGGPTAGCVIRPPTTTTELLPFLFLLKQYLGFY